MPRRDILLDSQGNRLLSGNDYAFADGAQAVKQGIECRLRLFLGEYWLDQSLGVDWLGDVLIANPNPAIINRDLSAAIASTPDVTQVVQTAYAGPDSSRRASASYSAASTEGAVSGTVAL